MQRPRKITPRPILRHILTAGDTQHPHPPLIREVVQQFRRDEEVLTAAPALPIIMLLIVRIDTVVVMGKVGFAARDANHAFVNEAFVAGIHALIDLVDDAEGGFGEGLQGHEVEDCGDGAFAAGLAVRVQRR